MAHAVRCKTSAMTGSRARAVWRWAIAIALTVIALAEIWEAASPDYEVWQRSQYAGRGLWLYDRKTGRVKLVRIENELRRTLTTDYPEERVSPP
jgi:hypothetical protein